jgi:hypothetical protein
LRENNFVIPRDDIDPRGVWEDCHGLKRGSGPIGWLVKPLCGPIAIQSPSFMYLQANNDMYVWN